MRIAIVCRGGRSQHQHKVRYAQPGTSCAPAPGASARRRDIAARLIFLSFIENGEIVESGTHDELRRHGGHYEKLWRYQSGGFLLDDAFDVEERSV
jgi:hypothetical protein